VTITGRGFEAGSAVFFDGFELSGTAVLNDNQMTATVPASLLATVHSASLTVSSGGAGSNIFSFSVLAAPPFITNGGVVSVAGGTVIAPGSLISVYGTGLATGVAAAPTIPLPKILAGVSVTVDGLPAPLFYASPTQINAQVPFEIPLGMASISVNVGAAAGQSVFTASAIAPGVFTLPDGFHTLAVNDATGAVGTSIAPGDWATIYVTGQGALPNQLATGDPAPTNPLIIPNTPVTVSVGAVPATNVAWAMAPTLIGLMQINFLMPAVAPGDQPLVVGVGGVTSNTTSISVSSQ